MKLFRKREPTKESEKAGRDILQMVTTYGE